MSAIDFDCFNQVLQEFFEDKTGRNLSFAATRISQSCELVGNEKRIVQNAVSKRVFEFATGRACARQSLRVFGIENFELLRGEFAEPLWPDGIAGSITHHGGIAIAVSMAKNQGYLGIDLVNLSENLPEPSAVLNDGEQHASICPASKNINLLLFSMKESVTKILSPLLRQYIDFKDISLSFDGETGKVDFRQQTMPIDVFWLCHGQYAVTLAVMTPYQAI